MTPVSKQPSTGDALPTTTTGTGTQENREATNTGATGKLNELPPSGPIGFFGQTIPAKFSKRNDILDRVPIMALPLPLTDEQLKQIYDAVIAENSPPSAGPTHSSPRVNCHQIRHSTVCIRCLQVCVGSMALQGFTM